MNPLDLGKGIGWTKAEFEACPDLVARLHARILDLRDEVERLKDEESA